LFYNRIVMYKVDKYYSKTYYVNMFFVLFFRVKNTKCLPIDTQIIVFIVKKNRNNFYH